jgi:hypothetical protein
MDQAPGQRAAATHWLTLFDPQDGEPYGETCNCPIGRDHDGYGTPNNPLDNE